MTLGQAALVQSPLGDLIISQGADQDFVYRYSTTQADASAAAAVDLSGWSARAQIRGRVGSIPWVTLTTDAPTTHGSSLTLDAEGYVRIHLHHAETEQIDWNSPSRIKGVWDLELVNPDGEVLRLVEGTVAVSQDVTRV